MEKSSSAFRTISEVATELAIPKHVLRFWEGKFTQLRPMKRGGGRRYYRPEDVDLLRGIRALLYSDGYTIKGVQRILRGNGVRFVKDCWREGIVPAPAEALVNIPNLAEEAASEARREKRNLERARQKSSSGAKPAEEVVTAAAPMRAEPLATADIQPSASGPQSVLATILNDLEDCRRILRRSTP